ncbi:sensor histidine kinase, partial [Pseudonocardia oceani]|uniref:sensor histidine kinase n=1 Tax=Pseudonocardia oceani TaxID=2792013 RepID=UPI0027E38F90
MQTVGGRTTEDRAAVVIRVVTVVAVGVALAAGPQLARGPLPPLAAIVLAALVYAVVLAVAEFRGRQVLPPRVATVVDGVLVLVACGLTGGAESIMVAMLPLVVIAASVLVGALVQLLERQLEAAAVSRARALAEHEAFLEERDLRARLLSAQQARLDGVRVVLHEFRTPVASLTALTADLVAGRLSEPSRELATRLLAEHAVHLRDMLDGLADVAVTDGSPIGRVRARVVPLSELADAVLDSAGVAAERRRPSVEPEGAAVRCDPQRLRRVLTNLVENAARHSGDAPVELALRYAEGRLVAEVRDRGPGLPPGQEGVVTAKGVALGERRGTAGLGLWIVEALVAAMDG